MKALILGSGGREHALAWKVAQSPLIQQLYWAPGNAATVDKCMRVALDINNHAEVADFIKKEGIGLVVIGPEQPLVEGLTNYLKATPGLSHLHIVGPSQEGAQLEGSKDFAKQFMARHNIPTARYKTFTAQETEQAKEYIRSQEQAPYVLKADGLAAGKGVLICETEQEAIKGIEDILGGQFGAAGNKIVIEQFLSGIECSVFVLTDGEHYTLLPTAKDYKRIHDADMGPNTGGMGAVSPVPFANDLFMQKVEKQIIRPTIDGLKKEGIDYRGFIFFGLICCNGNPYVIEYNCRMGDPETEVVMPRIQGDLVPALLALQYQTLGANDVQISPQTAATVVAVSGGYPNDYKKGYPIAGLNKNTPDTLVFHAGTTLSPQGDALTHGGRVLTVTGIGNSITEATEKSYQRMMQLCFTDMYYRKDIGMDLLRLQESIPNKS